MKTSIQQLIIGLKIDEENAQYAMERVSIRNCIIFATSLLETEKQQIIDAVKYGQNNHSISITHEEKMADNYYKETFKIT